MRGARLIAREGAKARRIPPQLALLRLHVQPAYALILVGFLALATLYNALTPLGEGPDEPGHLAYAFFLAHEGRLPIQRADPTQSDVPSEGHQPPLAYLLMVPAVGWLPLNETPGFLRANPQFLWNGGNEPGAFMRGSRELWPWEGIVLAWHLARGVSTLVGLLTVVATMRAAAHLFPMRPAVPLLAGALVAFNPQFLASSTLATNDALLAAFGAAIVLLTVAWTPSPNPRANTAFALWAGSLFGLALLTKQSALLFGPVLLWASWRISGGRMRQALVVTLGWGGVTLLIAGWWYLRNWHRYGDPFGLGVFKAEFTSQAFDWRSVVAWRLAVVQCYTSFWARFGWMSLRPPSWVNGIYAGLGLVALGGLVRAVVCRRTKDSLAVRWAALRFRMDAPWLALGIVAAMAFVWTLSFALTAGLVAWQGRMLFPALGAIAIILARGLASWRVPPLLLGAGLGALALFLPLNVIAPAYPRIPIAPAAATARIVYPAYARFAQSWEHGVELRGWRVAGAPTAGAPISITLTWHALEPIPNDWTVFIHLVDPAEQIVAESNQRPRANTFPMIRWTPGDWIEDTHCIYLPPKLPAGRYSVRVGLYLPAMDGQRQAVWGADGVQIGDVVEVGAVNVQVTKNQTP